MFGDFFLTPARLLFYAVRPGQATRPTMESTADMVFARVGPAFAESPSDSQRQSSDMEYAHNPQYTTNQLRTLGRSVTRSHPDAASDPDLPCYSTSLSHALTHASGGTHLVPGPAG